MIHRAADTKTTSAIRRVSRNHFIISRSPPSLHPEFLFSKLKSALVGPRSLKTEELGDGNVPKRKGRQYLNPAPQFLRFHYMFCTYS